MYTAASKSLFSWADRTATPSVTAASPPTQTTGNDPRYVILAY
jgi:hypothetical protein